jgi:membrane protein YdbS with pleckstrin-like domain
MRRYRILRTWSVALTVLAVVSLGAAAAGTIWWAIAADGLWETVAALAIGIPMGLLIGALPLAMAQGLRALADIGEDMAFEALTTAASSPY